MADWKPTEYQQAIIAMIRALAPLFDVDPDLAVEIVRLESTFRPWAIGDDGRAVGLWQWHYQSWVYVRQRMQKFGVQDPAEDRRAEPFESTITALYTIGKLGLGRWWSTWQAAHRNVYGARDGEDSDQR